MALDTAKLAAAVRRLLGGVSTDEYAVTAMDEAILAGLAEYSRFQSGKTQDVILSTSAGVDRYPCSVSGAIDVVVHGHHPASSSGMDITGHDGVVSGSGSGSFGTEYSGIIGGGMASMDAFLDAYEADLATGGAEAEGTVRIQGGMFIFDPPPSVAGSVYVRVVLTFTATDFPATAPIAYEALKYEVAAIAGEEVVAGRMKFGGFNIGPKKVALADPEKLLKMVAEYHEKFLALVKSSAGARG